jgi:hypothetical protein
MPTYFNWRSGFNRNLILSRLGDVRKIDGQRCSFSPGEDYYFWLPVLISAISAHPDVGLLKTSCVKQSLADASLTLNDPDAFLVRCDQAFATLSKRPQSKFIFYSTVTYKGPKVFDWISDGPFRIYWQPNDKGRFVRAALRAREDLSFKRRAHKIPDDNDELTTLLAHVSAYDISDAFEKANDCIDRFRGMLNLMINTTNSIHPFGGLAAPHAINRFRRGPFHTLHKPDGSLATETFWYEPRWEHNHPTVKFEDGPSFKKKFADWWRKLHDNPMTEFTSDALLKYCRALDLHEADAALLGMWQVLERMTGTDKYELLVDRITRLFRDHEDAREIANHLRIRRNQTVHSAHSISREAHVILHHVEMLAGQIIFFCIMNGAKFKNQNELNEFLDLPMDQRKLKRRQQLMRYFLEYQSKS